MLSTQTEDGSVLILIHGRFSASLVVFSQDPPGWQVRAMQEIHMNFEAANRGALSRGDHSHLVLPDFSRIFTH
jgi:hypothetical protein